MYTCIAPLGNGVCIGGIDPGYLDTLDHYTWDGTWDISAKQKDAGSIERVAGVAIVNEGTLLVCGTNTDSGGETYATYSALGNILAILTGPHNQPPGSAFHDMVSLDVPAGQNHPVLLAGYATPNGGPVRSGWVVQKDDGGFTVREWHITFGDDSEAVSLLPLADGTFLTVGHGNGSAVGSTDTAEGRRLYLAHIALPPFEMDPGNG